MQFMLVSTDASTPALLAFAGFEFSFAQLRFASQANAEAYLHDHWSGANCGGEA